MHRVRISLILLVICTMVVGAGSVGAAPERAPQARPLADVLGGGFTYQGQLKQGGTPLTDACNFQFTLWDAATSGSQVGPVETRLSLPVSGGLFTAEDLDFGAAAFDGDARWLEIDVMCTGDSDYVALSPRQVIAAAPYALFAPAAGTAESADYATSAGSATSATNATNATNATFATSAGSAATATNATNATFATSAGSATTATSAGSAASAPWAGLTGIPPGFADDTDNVGTGTVISVGTGAGLTGGPITTSGTISLATGGVASSHIANGAILAEDLFDGTALAEILDDDGIGSGLDADLLDGQHAGYYQRAVGGSCPPGSSIRDVAADGTVTCETDDDTTYTNGTGILLATNQFSANFTTAGGENGSSPTVARGDHTHNSLYVNAGEALSISSGMIVADAVSTAQIVNGTLTFADWSSNGCSNLQIPRYNGSMWVCVNDSTGTVTSVGTGSGLTGGPITGTGTISIATGGVTSTHILDATISPSDIADGATLFELADDDGPGSGLDADLLDGAQGSAYQLRVGSTCSIGSSIRVIGADGSVQCETDDAGTGTVTSVGTASGLSGGPITTTGTIGIATNGVTSSHILDGTVSYLDLQDTAALAEISDDDGAGSFLDADLLDGLQGSAYAPASHAHSSLNASDGSPTNAVYLDSDGHVGIGTTSPGADTLSVVGGVRVNGLLTLPFVINTTVDGLAAGAYVDIPIETVTGLAFYNATTYNSYWSTNTKLRAWVWAEALDVSGSGNQNKYWVRIENIGTETATAYDSVLVIKMAGFTP